MRDFLLDGRFGGERNRCLSYLLLSSFTESKKVSQNSSRRVRASSFSTHYPRSGWRTTWSKPSFPPGSCLSHFLPARSVLVKRHREWWNLTCQPEEEFWEVPEAKSAHQHSAGFDDVATVASVPRGGGCKCTLMLTEKDGPVIKIRMVKTLSPCP